MATRTFAAIRTVATRRTFYRDLVLLSAGLSLGALLVAMSLVLWLVNHRVANDVGGVAKRAAESEAARFDRARFGPLIRALGAPSHPESTLGLYLATLTSSDAAAFRQRLNDYDDPSRDDAPILPLTGEEAEMKAFSTAMEAAKARQFANGLTSVGVLVPRGGRFFLVDAAQGGYPYLPVDPDSGDSNDALKRATLAGGGSRATPIYNDHWGSWFSGYAPLMSERGEVIAVLEADVKAGPMAIFRQSVAESTLLGFALVAVAALAASGFLARHFARRVGSLTDGIERLGAGDFSARIDDPHDDEIGAMGRAFNEMARSMGEKDRMRTILEEAVSRPVAKELLRGSIPEQCEATVLFSDIRGFTALSEELVTVEIVELLNEYFSEMAPIVERHGGIVDKFIGDGMLAVFGAPEFLPNDALSAVHAAQEMRSALRAWNERRGSQGKRTIEIGIGINTGMIIAGTLGSTRRRNYTVLGSAVNLGARLCSKAKPMSIVVSASTAGRLGPDVPVREIEALTLKGITGPVRAWEVI